MNRGCFCLQLLVSALMIASQLHAAEANYAPLGSFIYVMPNGQAVNPGTSGDFGVSSFVAQQGIAGLYRHNTLAALSHINGITRDFFNPTQESLAKVKDAEERGDSAAATAAINAAQSKLTELKTSKPYLPVTAGFVAYSGNNKPLADLATAFFKYEADLEKSLTDAQAIPAAIEKRIKDNEAGVRLLSAAHGYHDESYRPGMQCSDLVVKASREAGITIDETVAPGTTLTGTWFSRGMGAEYRQILGGDAGMTLRQLAGEETDATKEQVFGPPLRIPIGAVIVADGHAALYAGNVKVGDTYQLIVYDSNAEKGWTISLDSQPTPSEWDPAAVISFPGHQVGEHVTRLQWGAARLVKVFQPIGNHPAPLK